MQDDQSLLYACYVNDLNLIKDRLKAVKPTHLKQKTQETGTPLHAAALNGNVEAVDLLLSVGADMEAKNFLGDSVMLNCINKGKLEMARHLIEKGADIHKKGCQNRNALNQLVCFAWDKTFAEYLLQKGSSINETARDQSSLIEAATSFNNPEAVDFLLSHGIDKKYLNAALCWGIIHNGVSAVKLLLDKGADLNDMYAQCKGIEKSLYHTVATREGYEDMLQLLVEHGVDFTKAPDRAIVLHVDKTKLSPLDYTKEHIKKWPQRAADLTPRIKIMEQSLRKS